VTAPVSAQSKAGFAASNRVGFNIKGSDYRLVVAMNYPPVSSMSGS
jgi:mRNA-degrading endonuclease HigB of HigAB toxin-antitoxin module